MGNSRGGTNRNTSSKQTAHIAERRAKALALRKVGYSFREIAKHTSVSVQVAHNDVMTELRNIPKAEADELRALETEKLNQLEKAWWPSAIAGDDKAAGVILKIIDRRARMLGLDLPTKHILDATGDGNFDPADLANKLIALVVPDNQDPGSV
ncbi:hypothetical protein [Hoyosella altamirensis]|uniref:Uncharacterized protein n=1 Tax=Hoyosella altamirensis TaxID=616997 RepID=A0A839RWF1_9ACTN|nr:hypothetical protein [Hoyosella altamirensis]MBB3040173.1 hypothetical protein [Hoyosella altamirensis]